MTDPSDVAWELAHAIWTSALGTEIERVQDPHDAARLIDAALATTWDEAIKAAYYDAIGDYIIGDHIGAPPNPYREQP